ncbi:hypothetical protein GCM10029978_081460 [Actinoallomurus acanthiterrae]
MADDEGGRPAGDSMLGPLLEFASRVLAPAGVLTALLYYFGYTRMQALYDYFGVDLGSVGFATTDYLVRSAGPLFAPLASVLVAGVAVVIAHHVLVLVLDRLSPRWRCVIWGCLAAGALAALTIGAIGLDRRAALADPILSPVGLGAGALLLEYAIENALICGTVPERLAAVLASTRVLRRGLLIGVALVAAFWATASVAERQGRTQARAIEVSLVFQPKAIVYSRERLQIEAPGVRVVRLGGGADSAYAYRYDGLRTLVHARGRWFLLPAGWRRDNESPVILLPDSRNDIRVDLAA